MGTHSPTASTQTLPEMDAFKGKFQRSSEENYEELLKLLDVNLLLRKAATVSTPVVEISENDGVFTIKSSTTLKSTEMSFKLGEAFDETTPDGREVTGLANLEDGKLVITQKAKKEGVRSSKSVREMTSPDELTYTITVDGKDLVCTQKYKDCSLTTTTTVCVMYGTGVNIAQVPGYIVIPVL